MYRPSCPRLEILSSFARELCSAAQHFVCTSESSTQRSEQSVFAVSLKLPSSTIQNPFTTGSPIESSIYCSLWTENSVGMCLLQLLCPSSSSPIQTASDDRWHQYPNHVKLSLRKCHTFVPTLRANQQNSSHHSIHHDSSNHSIHHDSSHHETKNCQWNTSVRP